MMHRLKVWPRREKDRRIKIRIDHRYSKKESHVKRNSYLSTVQSRVGRRAFFEYFLQIKTKKILVNLLTIKKNKLSIIRFANNWQVFFCRVANFSPPCEPIKVNTDYRRPVRKSSSMHGRKSNSNPKFIGMAEAYFVCQIGPKFQVSWIYTFIGCP